jgi:hypothetical protein
MNKATFRFNYRMMRLKGKNQIGHNLAGLQDKVFQQRLFEERYVKTDPLRQNRMGDYVRRQRNQRAVFTVFSEN